MAVGAEQAATLAGPHHTRQHASTAEDAPISTCAPTPAQRSAMLSPHSKSAQSLLASAPIVCGMCKGNKSVAPKRKFAVYNHRRNTITEIPPGLCDWFQIVFAREAPCDVCEGSGFVYFDGRAFVAASPQKIADLNNRLAFIKV